MLCQRVVRLPRTFVKRGRLLSSGVPLHQQHDLNNPEEEVQELRLPPSMMSNLMDIGARRIFDKDQDMFRESVRRFVRDELVPEQAKCEERGHPTREMWEKMGEAGLLGVLIPAEVGGVGGTFKEEAIVTEEMAYANVTAPAHGLHSTIVMPYFANNGTKEQQEKYIPAMTAGKCVSAIAMTEPDAGSDLQGVRTNAVKDGDHYIINGSKTYITNGYLADVVVVVAATNKDAKSKAHGITLFLVDDGTPGFTKGKPLKKVGLKTQDTAELFFEDVRVHKSAILGGLNQGFYKLMTELPQERLSIAVAAAASSEWMFEETRAWIRNRRAFGKNLSNLMTIQHKMAELKTSIAVTRSFVDECIELHTHKALDNQMASMAKYWATDLQNRVASECVQLHGGWGFMWETPIAKAFADSRVTTIFGGTNEIMKNLIARSIINDK